MGAQSEGGNRLVKRDKDRQTAVEKRREEEMKG